MNLRSWHIILVFMQFLRVSRSSDTGEYRFSINRAHSIGRAARHNINSSRPSRIDAHNSHGCGARFLFFISTAARLISFGLGRRIISGEIGIRRLIGVHSVISFSRTKHGARSSGWRDCRSFRESNECDERFSGEAN